MDELWVRMASRYGHAWVSQYGPLPDGIAAAEWRSTLAGMTPAQLREGFEADALRGGEWPPSSPKFRSLCLGIPPIASVRREVSETLSGAYRQAQVPVNISSFTRGVLSRLDMYNYRNASGKVAERMLKEAYDLTCEFVMSGGVLPVPPAGYIAQGRKEFRQASPEVAKAHLDKIAEVLRTEPVTPHTEVDP